MSLCGRRFVTAAAAVLLAGAAHAGLPAPYQARVVQPSGAPERYEFDLTPALRAAISLAAWSPGVRFTDNQVPTLLLAGSADILAGGQSQGFFDSIPESTPKMLFEVAGGGTERILHEGEIVEPLDLGALYGRVQAGARRGRWGN